MTATDGHTAKFHSAHSDEAAYASFCNPPARTLILPPFSAIPELLHLQSAFFLSTYVDVICHFPRARLQRRSRDRIGLFLPATISLGSIHITSYIRPTIYLRTRSPSYRHSSASRSKKAASKYSSPPSSSSTLTTTIDTMFPVDSLHPSYYEDRSAEKSKKPSSQQPQFPSASTSSSQRPSAQFLQRPPLSRPGSSTVIGTIYNGFVRANSPAASSDRSACSSGSSTPVLASSKLITQADIEAMMTAERKKDADIQAFRAW